MVNTLMSQSGRNQILFQRCCPLCSHCNYHKVLDHLGSAAHQLNILVHFLHTGTGSLQTPRLGDKGNPQTVFVGQGS